MDTTIEWIKTAIGLCSNNELEILQKKELFTQLGAIYRFFSSEEKNYIEEILLTQLEVNDAIYIYSQLCCFIDTYEIRRGLFHAILQGDFNECSGSMIELQTCRYTEGFYKERRILHKKNVEKFRQKLDSTYPYHPVNRRNSKRIVIVTEQLLSILHAPTQVVLNFAYVLQKRLGYEVMIFACPSNAMLPEELWYQPVEMHAIDEYRYLPIRREYKGAVFKGYQIDMYATYLREYSQMLDFIYEWNPMCVLELGAVNPIVDLTSDFTTLVSMPMGIACPVSEGELLIRLGRMDEKTETEYLNVLDKKQTQIFIDEKIPVLTEKSQQIFTRKDLGLPENDFLIAIVGNRLDEEIDTTFIGVMKQIWEKYENASFVIIGDVSELPFYFNEEIYTNRIFYLGFCSNLMATYNVIDLYLNPKRAGGGFSSAMALTAGVPVVTLPDCDVAYNVGEAFIVADIEKMIAEVHRYINDTDFYNCQKAYAEQLSQKNSMDKMEQYVKSIMDKITVHMSEEKTQC